MKYKFILMMVVALMHIATASAGCGLTHPSLNVELIGPTDSQLLGETEYFFAVYAINDKDCTFCDPAKDLNVYFLIYDGEIVRTNNYSFDSCTVDASNTVATFYRGSVKEKESLIGYIWLKTPNSGSFTITVDGIEFETDGGCIVNSNSVTKTYTIYSGLSERECFAKLAEQRAETLTKYKEMYLIVLGLSGGSWEENTNRQIAEAMALSIQFAVEVGESINVDPTSASDASKGMYAIFTDEIPFLGAPLRTFESILNVGTGMFEQFSSLVAYNSACCRVDEQIDDLIILYNKEATAWREDTDKAALETIFDDEYALLEGDSWCCKNLREASKYYKNEAISREEAGNAALFSSIETFAFNDAIKTIPLLRASVEAVCNTPPSSEFTPLDLCMVLDRSGSMDDPMGDKKKIEGAKEAATDVVDVLMPQDRVSLISFSSTATTDIDFTSDFSAVKTEINQLSAYGWTSFGAGLQAALDQFDTHGNPDYIPAILFMSDGVHTTAPDPDAFVTECKNKEIPIFTVGFAASESEVDVARLRNMADETGGEYLFADDIFELQNIFIGLQHKASGWESEATYTGEVNQGQTVTAGSFDIDPSTKNSRITLNWPGSDLDLELLNPDGIPVNFSAPDIIYSGDTKPEYVILKEPQPGTWTVRVYGKVVDSSEDYYVLVTEYVPPGSQICKTQITSDPSMQDRPSIVNANGDYYVAYQSWETGSSYNGDIFIKKYDSKWNEIKKEQITDNPYYQDSPSLVFANNELYVALITNHEGATWDDYDVYLKKYDSNLNYISGSGRYLTALESYQDLPSLFYKDGYFYLAYSSWESGSSYNGDIYIKKFDSGWNQIKKVRITSETSLQTRPSVIYANGYFYVGYYSKETGNRDIFVKRLDANLNLDSWKKQITSESSSQSFPSISFANNEYAIVYASYETGTIGIYMKTYDLNWNFIEKTKIVDESSAQERRPSHIWDGSNYLVSYVHNYTANDDWNIFTVIPGCNEGQLSQTTSLQVLVSETPDSVTSGETSQVTIHVRSSADGLPVQGASVMVSAIGGSVAPSSGTTDSNGDFKPTYHAPTVTSPTICLISATTSKTGYASGSGSDTIVVNPQGGQTTYSIPLHTGWNLISVPLNLNTWELGEESVVGDPLNVTPENSLAAIYRYDNQSESFEMCIHYVDWGWYPETESFTELEPGRGYWLWAENDCTLTFTGTAPSDLDVSLDSGWNCVGWYSTSVAELGEGSMVDDPLNVTPENSLAAIYRYDNPSESFEMCIHYVDWGWYPATASFTELEPGRGYWLWAENDCLWNHET